MQDLSAAVKAQKPGDKVELTVLRDGKEIAVVVTLGERPSAPGRTGSPRGSDPESAAATPGDDRRRLAGDQRYDASRLMWRVR